MKHNSGDSFMQIRSLLLNESDGQRYKMTNQQDKKNIIFLVEVKHSNQIIKGDIVQ